MKKRKFYIGFSFVMDDGFGIKRFEGNVGLEFAATAKKDTGLYNAAKEFIAERFELENPDMVTIVMFDEMEG